MNQNFMQRIITLIMIVAISISVLAMCESAKAKTEWTESTFTLRKTIVKMWVDFKLATFIINECKETAKDPRKCVKTAVAIYGNESGFGKYCKNNSCFWVISKKYTSQQAAAKDWIKRYNKYWHKHNWWSFFYGGKWWKGPSGYCHSEVSSWSKLWCPNWSYTFNYFYSLI